MARTLIIQKNFSPKKSLLNHSVINTMINLTNVLYTISPKTNPNINRKVYYLIDIKLRLKILKNT